MCWTGRTKLTQFDPTDATETGAISPVQQGAFRLRAPWLGAKHGTRDTALEGDADRRSI